MDHATSKPLARAYLAPFAVVMDSAAFDQQCQYILRRRNEMKSRVTAAASEDATLPRPVAPSTEWARCAATQGPRNVMRVCDGGDDDDAGVAAITELARRRCNLMRDASGTQGETRRLECLSSDDNDDRRTVRSAHRPHCQVPSPWALHLLCSLLCSAQLPITFLSSSASAWPVHAKISNVQWFSAFYLSALELMRCLARQKKTKISLRACENSYHTRQGTYSRQMYLSATFSERNVTRKNMSYLLYSMGHSSNEM